MQFNAGTTSIVSKVRKLTRTNSTDYPLADIAHDANLALDEILTECVIPFDKRFEFDDYNHSGLPTYTANLVAGTRQYDVQVSGTNDIVMWNKVLILDRNSKWVEVEPVDDGDLFGQETVLQNASNGQPAYYDKRKASIIFDVAPDYSATGGFKLLFTRANAYWLGDDSTDDDEQEPGFPSPYHDLVYLICAREYSLEESLDKYNWIVDRVDKRKEAFRTWIKSRNNDENAQIIPQYENNE